VAGSSTVKLKHTSAATGKVVSAEIAARCADDPYTYTASFDKASYNQGDIATLTVKFLDSKGNPSNSTVAVGTSQIVLPMMTFVSATGTATSLTKADGTIAYTLTVGTTTGMTAGTYSGIVDFTALTAVAATKATPTSKLSTGGDTTTNADVLKSIVALIASINKQIQALQKLILKK
jgi:ABC-type dipeptide/oligopeptide/nickel transport system permease subunit